VKILYKQDISEPGIMKWCTIGLSRKYSPIKMGDGPENPPCHYWQRGKLTEPIDFGCSSGLEISGKKVTIAPVVLKNILHLCKRYW